MGYCQNIHIWAPHHLNALPTSPWAGSPWWPESPTRTILCLSSKSVLCLLLSSLPPTEQELLATMITMFNTLDLMLQAAVPLGKDQRKKVDHRNHLQITKSSRRQYVLQIIRVLGDLNRIKVLLWKYAELLGRSFAFVTTIRFAIDVRRVSGLHNWSRLYGSTKMYNS